MNNKPTPASQQSTAHCPTCGTHEISLARTCHNSSCADYAREVTIYKGWRAVEQTSSAPNIAAFSCAKRGAEPSNEFAACRKWCGDCENCYCVGCPQCMPAEMQPSPARSDKDAEREVTTDCRSPEGIATGLIDGIIAVARVLRSFDQSHPAVIEALKDLRSDEDVAALLAERAPSGESIDHLELAREAGFSVSGGFVMPPHAGHITEAIGRLVALARRATADTVNVPLCPECGGEGGKQEGNGVLGPDWKDCALCEGTGDGVAGATAGTTAVPSSPDKCRYCGGDGEHYQGPSQYAECEPCNGTGERATAGTTAGTTAAPDELLAAAKAFYNATVADTEVLIRANSAAKRDAVIAAGERLREAMTAGNAAPTGEKA